MVKLCSDIWNKEDEKVKLIYKNKSNIEKNNHINKYPDYKYKPIKNKIKKRKKKIYKKYKNKYNYSFSENILKEYYEDDYVNIESILLNNCIINNKSNNLYINY